MPKKKIDIKTAMSEKPIAIDPVKAEIIDKPKVKKATIDQLMEMDNKIWNEIDALKGNVYKLKSLVHRVADRMGIDEKTE